MLNEIEYKKIRWENLCSKECCSPFDHSHEFELGKDIEKDCSHCKRKMKADTQVYGCELGKNIAILRNDYKCECGFTDVMILYKGENKDLEEIYKTVVDR